MGMPEWFDEMLLRGRRTLLIGYDGFVWLVSVLLVVAVRFMDIGMPVPWSRGLTAAAVAIGVQMILGTLLWLYDGRYVVGSKDEALHLGVAVTGAGFIMGVVSLNFPDARLIPLSTTLGATAMAIVGCVGGRMLWRMRGDPRPGVRGWCGGQRTGAQPPA